jgi:hypothetical protein
MASLSPLEGHQAVVLRGTSYSILSSYQADIEQVLNEQKLFILP